MNRATRRCRGLLTKIAFVAYLSVCILPSCVLAEQNQAISNTSAPRAMSLTEMFTFLFLMLGPLKILGPFVQLTRKGDQVFARRLAIRAFIYSCLALAFAAMIGE